MKRPWDEKSILKTTKHFSIFQVHKHKISQKPINKMAKQLVEKGELEIAYQDSTRIYYVLPGTSFTTLY